MNKRFLKLYESAMYNYKHDSNYNRSGFLAGDVVKFVDNCIRDPFFKTVQKEYKEKVTRLIDSGVNLRVINIKSNFPAVMGAGNPDYNGYGFAIEVAPEDEGLGRIVQSDSISVPQHLLTPIDFTPNLPTVPDKFKYKDKTHIKPVEVKDEAEEIPFYSPARTRTADLGNNKDTKSETSLGNKNVKIPSVPAKGAASPASYTASYLP